MSNFGTLLPFKTKKALREFVATGSEVLVTDTSAFDNRGCINITELSPLDVIVGPNVYTDRKWYANYKNGKIV